MSNQQTRRQILRNTAILGTAGLAGCSTNNNQSSDNNGNNTDDKEQEPQEKYTVTGYELDSSTINLTDINSLDLSSYTKNDIENNYFAEVELKAYLENENGEKIEEDLTNLIEFHLENNSGEQVNINNNTVPEYKVKDGEVLNAIINKEDVIQTLEEQGYDNIQDNTHQNPETKITKETPEYYRRDIWVEGSKDPWLDWQELITGNRPDAYETEFVFDTQNFSFDEYYETRKAFIESTTGEERTEKAGNELNLEGLSKKDKIIEVSHWTNNNIGRDSTNTLHRARYIERILREHGNIDEPIAGGGFHNPMDPNSDRNGNHGSQMLHVDGDNYHSETTIPFDRNQAVHVDDIDTLAMDSSSGNLSDFVSVMGGFTPGFPELNGDFETGMSRLRGMLWGLTVSKGADAMAVAHDHKSIFRVRDEINNNKFEEALLGQMAGGMRHVKEEEYTSLATLDDEVVAITSTNSNLNSAIESSQSTQGKEIIKYAEQRL